VCVGVSVRRLAREMQKFSEVFEPRNILGKINSDISIECIAIFTVFLVYWEVRNKSNSRSDREHINFCKCFPHFISVFFNQYLISSICIHRKQFARPERCRIKRTKYVIFLCDLYIEIKFVVLAVRIVFLFYKPFSLVKMVN
jgi:hypothetical protein